MTKSGHGGSKLSDIDNTNSAPQEIILWGQNNTFKSRYAIALCDDPNELIFINQDFIVSTFKNQIYTIYDAAIFERYQSIRLARFMSANCILLCPITASEVSSLFKDIMEVEASLGHSINCLVILDKDIVKDIDEQLTIIESAYSFGLNVIEAPTVANKNYILEIIAEESKLSPEECFVKRKEIAISSEHAMYKRVQRIVDQEANNSLPTDKLPFQLYGKDLRQSKNADVMGQLKYASHLENKNIYCLRSQDNWNTSEQIHKDAGRHAEFGDEMAEIKTATPAELENELIKLFGVQLTALLIKNFDQAIYSLILGPAMTALNCMDFGVEQNVELRIKHRIYSKDHVIFRSVELNQLIINMYDESMEKWKFKANIKLLSYATNSGFVVERICTDNALICRAYMEKSCSHLLRKLIDIVKNIRASLEKIPKELKIIMSTNKENVLGNMEKSINDFTSGEITLDGWVESLKNSAASMKLVNKQFFPIVPNVSSYKFSKTDIKPLLENCTNLFKLKNQIDAGANRYRARQTLEAKSGEEKEASFRIVR